MEKRYDEGPASVTRIPEGLMKQGDDGDREETSFQAPPPEIHHKHKRKGPGRGIFILIIVILCLALALTILFYEKLVLPVASLGGAASPGAGTEAGEPAEAGEPPAEPDSPEAGDLEQSGWISPETLKYWAQEFYVSTEFLQHFFPDSIIYKQAGLIVYGAIDPNLPKNDYNWDNLTWKKGRAIYTYENGETARTGIDVSRYQGENIDWEKVAADGIDFAMIRVGYRGYGSGELVPDEFFEANIQGALAAGLDVGVYFFSQAITTEEAEEEAAMLLEAIEGYNITFPVVYDIEEVESSSSRTIGLTAEQVTSQTLAFCEKVEQAGYRPMVYSNTKWFVSWMDLSQLTGYDKWLAQYYNRPYYPYDFTMWQYSSSGRVDGIKGDVDLNLCFTDYTGD